MSASAQTAPLAAPAAMEIHLGSGPLATKLDVIAAALVAIREAHRDTMKPECWAALHRAEAALAEATLNAGDRMPPRLSYLAL